MNRLAVLGLMFAAYRASAAGSTEQFFDQRVAPILIRRCIGCHNELLKNGGLALVDRSSLLKGGGRGPAIVPGKPKASLLIQTLRHDGNIQMPPGPPLPSKEIAILTEWIRRGAVWGTKLPKSE